MAAEADGAGREQKSKLTAQRRHHFQMPFVVSGEA
jgi:hypothetical protein